MKIFPEVYRNLAVGIGIALLTLPMRPSQAHHNPTRGNRCHSQFHIVKTQDGDPLNLRSNPSNAGYEDNNSRIIGVIPNGSEVLLRTGDRTGEWAEVALKGGQVGWVAIRYLSRHSVENATYSGQMQVKTLDGDSVAIRNSQMLGGELVTYVQSGDIVTEIKSHGFWSEVETSRGLRGYIVNAYLVCR